MWFVHHNLESSFLSLLPNPHFCQTPLPFRDKPGVSFSSQPAMWVPPTSHSLMEGVFSYYPDTS